MAFIFFLFSQFLSEVMTFLQKNYWLIDFDFLKFELIFY